MDPITVAIDVGPLRGHLTGVGVAVDRLCGALRARPGVQLLPYLVSARAEARSGERKLPLPAALATRAWARTGRPRADRWLPWAQVVHGTNYVAPPTRLPTVVSVYDLWFLANPRQATPAVRRAGAVLRRAVRRGAYVHATSQATADAARELLGTDRVAVVHLGTAGAPGAPGADPVDPGFGIDGRPFILSVATFEKRKSLPTLVEAFGQIATRLDDSLLVLAGAPGDDSDRVGAAIDRLPADVRQRVIRPGRVSDGAKAWLLKRSSVLVYPSLDEGFGFPILEAQAAGTPIVARRAGSIPEIGGDGVELVEGDDPAAYADAIEHVVTSGVKRLTLLEAGLRNVARFSWERTAEGMEALYRRAAEDGS
jgi:glycosyltransferase involved in cell wall biosynthesis